MGKIMVLNASLKGVAVAKSLMKAGHDVYMHDYREGMFGTMIPGLASNRRGLPPKYNNIYPNPKISPEHFINVLIYMIELIKPDMVFPTNSIEMNAIYEAKFAYRIALMHKTKFPFDLDQNQQYTALRDKYLYQLYALKLGHTPKTIEHEKGTYYQKPLKKTSGRGIKKITFKEDVVFQQGIDGIGIGFEALCDKGKVLCSFMHQRIREFPIAQGSSTSRYGMFDSAIYGFSIDYIKKSGWTGFIMLEFKRNEDTFYLIEVNPRVWGSIQLAIDAGIDFPVEAYDYFVEGRIPISGLIWNMDRRVETRIFGLDFLAGIGYLFKKGDWRNFLDAFNIFKKCHWEFVFIRNPIVTLFVIYSACKMLLLPIVNFARKKFA